MIIVAQNINQSKIFKKHSYPNLTTYENCYDKLIKQNPDIIILSEVQYKDAVRDALKNYQCFVNRDIYIKSAYYDRYADIWTKDEMLQNKIFIAIKNDNIISDVSIDEKRYIDGKLDYLKISFIFNNERYNIVGLRFYSSVYNKDGICIKKNDANNDILESILRENIGTKTIIAGDFNNGYVAEESYKNYENYPFNIHTINRICNQKFKYRIPQYKFVTVPSLELNTVPPQYDINEWTYQKRCEYGNYLKEPTDHFIISNNFGDIKYELIKDFGGVDAMCDKYYKQNPITLKYEDETYKSGIPDHRIIKLEIQEDIEM